MLTAVVEHEFESAYVAQDMLYSYQSAQKEQPQNTAIQIEMTQVT